MRESHSITQERLHELFDYRDGYLIWKKQSSKNFYRAKIGDIAGHLSSIKNKNYKLWQLKIDGKNLLAHRMIYTWHYGDITGFDIDHKDGNSINNKIENLRLATPSQNAKNHKLSRISSSGVSGVSWQSRDEKWQARIICDKKYIHLGYFDDLIEAVIARKKAEQKYFGEWARK